MKTFYQPWMELLESRCVLDSASVSAAYGIHAQAVQGPTQGSILTGNMVRIGQVEEYRSGDPMRAPIQFEEERQ